MRQFKEIVLGIIVIAAVCFLIYKFLEYDRARNNRELAKQIAELSPRGGPPETIEGLIQAITIYEAQIERNVKEGAQIGVYWKILASRFAERNLHNNALDALERAIYYNAEDPALYYLTGVSSGIVAKSIVGFNNNAQAEREHYFVLCENSYLRAIELDNTYARPIYGLAVLYAFELDRPNDAIPFIERFLEIQRNDISALFILARCYYLARRFSDAIDIYEDIIRRTKDVRAQEEASNNIDLILRMQYE